MTENRHDIPTHNDDDYVDNFIEASEANTTGDTNGANHDQTQEPAAPVASSGTPSAPRNNDPAPAPPRDDGMNQRLERLGGEPAPVITPEEFARLQRTGQVNIDSRGRVRMARRSGDEEAGVSLRKRRAWYR